MNCVSCGALITSKHKKCPYCGAKNPEYERKSIILKGLDAEKREAEAETKRTFKTIWQDKLCNICLVASIALFVLSFAAIIIGIIIVGGVRELMLKFNYKEYQTQMDAYFNAGEYGQLDAYMDDNELFDYENNYRNGQAALMYSFMTEFRVNVYPYIEYLHGKNVDLRYRKSAWTILYDAQKTLCWQLSVYPDIHPENQAQYDSYRKEIKDVLITYFNLTEEEFEDCFEGGKFYKSEYEDILLERNDFIEE